MSGWVTEELSKHITFVDYRGKTPTKVDSGMRLITAKNVKMGFINIEPQEFVNSDIYDEWMTRGIPKKGDVLFTTEAPLGNVAQLDVDGKVVIGQRLITMQPDNEFIDSTFLKYALLSPQLQDEIQSRGTGATVLGIKAKLLKQIPFSYPPIPEQKRIVAILDQAFADIKQARAKTEQNLKNARELFENYLQQVFEQLGDDCEDRFMSDEAMLSMIDGDRGKNYPKKSEFLSDGHCLFLSTKNVRPDGFLFEETMFIDEKRDSLLRKGKLVKNDVVITTRGTIGNLALYDDSVDYPNIRINSGMLILRPDTTVITPAYLFEIMRSGIVKRQIEDKVSGAAQPQLPVKTLNSFSFPVPKSLEMQQQVVEKIKVTEISISELIENYEAKLASLDELKKSILQKAFSGELTKAPDSDISKGAAA